MTPGLPAPSTERRAPGGPPAAAASPAARLGRTLQRAAQLTVLHTLRIPVRLALGALCQARLVGQERIPRRGGVIVAANHTSLADPVVLQAYLPRHLTYLMTDKFHHIRPVRWFVSFWGVVVVKQAGINRDAMRGAMAALGRGDAVGIFPEGGVSRDGRVHDPLPGIALLAQRTGAPVVPVGLAGIGRFLAPDTWTFRRSRITMAVGSAIDPQGASRHELAERVNHELRAAAAAARAIHNGE